MYAMFMPMAMFFYILFYVSMPFNEERTEFKKLQPISPFVYWTSVYIFDALIHAIYSYFMYTIHRWADTHHLFDEKEYSKFGRSNQNEVQNLIFRFSLFDATVMFFAIYLLYGLAYLPIIYMVCQMFRTMSSIYSFLTYMFVIFCKYQFASPFYPEAKAIDIEYSISFADIIASFIASSEDNMKTYDVCISVFLIFPDYALTHALHALLLTYVKQRNQQYNFNFGMSIESI